MIRRVILSLLLAVSAIGTMSIGASAEWKQDKYQNWTWKEKGVEAKGWKQINGLWYNFGTDGIMKTDWMEDNGEWYYFWSDGSMAYDTWVWNGGFWYFFDENGKMVSDSAIVENRKYDFTAPAIIVSDELNSTSTTSSGVTVSK